MANIFNKYDFFRGTLFVGEYFETHQIDVYFNFYFIFYFTPTCPKEILGRVRTETETHIR